MKLSREEVGRRYAVAFYDYAVDNHVLDDVYQELQTLKEVIDANPKFVSVLVNPVLDLSEKEAVLAQVKTHFSPTVQKLIQIVFDYQRFDNFSEIISAFNLKYEIENNRGHGQVVTAVEMTADQLEKLGQTYANKNGLTNFTVTNEIDPSIIGGAILKTDGKIIDGSIKTKLAAIRADLVNKI